MKKINIAILFGGKSAEHEVSLQSARNVYDALDKEKYNPILIGIDKQGRWLLNEDSHFLIHEDNPKLIALNASKDMVTFAPECNGQISNVSSLKDHGFIDVAFPILHGPMGEDGTVQGLLKLANIPFVGASVLGSAVGMDKDVMKRLLRDAGLPIVAFRTVHEEDEIPDYVQVAENLGEPFFIKPANMGSSVGVGKVHSKDEYIQLVQRAFMYDTKIIIEEYVRGRELECSVLGNSKPIASTVGEILSNHEFYSYEAKYVDEHGAVLDIPAKIPERVRDQVQDLAIKTFKTLSCEGLGRVDMFLKDDDTLVVNEINTIPGFTKISMYPKLWEVSGISYEKLIDRLIELAMERHTKENRLRTSYL